MKWQCGGCGLVWDGDDAPETCPKCGAPKEKFAKLDAERVKLIDRSRKTNCLHMQLGALIAQVKDVADQGIEDNLDPGCLAIFTKTRDCAMVMAQQIKAELETHVKKGKWG